MKKALSLSIVIFIALFFQSFTASSQADEIMGQCKKYMEHPFISDGQQYRALLNGDEVAEFRATFYGGSTYRIVACSGVAEGNIIFTVRDSERNILFSSRDHENTPYWDFSFKSTMDCIIEAELDTRTNSSGFAILLIGFKQ